VSISFLPAERNSLPPEGVGRRAFCSGGGSARAKPGEAVPDRGGGCSAGWPNCRLGKRRIIQGNDIWLTMS
jgi:hypothetical protein